eukprot:CAMPEP_0180815870 /NCGR_PEP_ID=MMETSP1038_2-20121128/67853_1 /TAXON_ID=632150 /ORGANISM="Azadinium spinosum, Strain 3D9" /LENGTH=48 /DNA_ID= /DNA_START= /DNA_END= /DNA_ORIENTATION=
MWDKSSEYRYCNKALKTSGSQSSTSTVLDTDSRIPLCICFANTSQRAA